MSRQSLLSEMRLCWHEARERGEGLTPEQLCINHPELLRELKQQISAVESMEAAIKSCNAGTEDSATSTNPVLRASAKELTIPGFEILEELGRGGMGVVYKARQVKLKRLVALKMILSGSHARPDQLGRFRAEAEAVARFQHPNIVQIHEISEKDGLPYFALEFVDGGSLDKRLNGTPLPPRQAAHIVETLARAMHYAHERGVIHRDLKPGNVLLTTGKFMPKITDFGLAKQVDDDAGQTKSGAVMGTPSYMAPEQAEGRIKEIGPHTDVYALGAILYELLTGRPPFRGASSMDTMMQVLTQDPVPPSRLHPKVSHDLETICLCCLQKVPVKRYTSAGSLADDLRRFLSGEPIQARRTPLWERTWKWMKRRPAAALLLGVSLLALFVLLAGWISFTARLQIARNQSEQARKDAVEQQHLAEQRQTLAEQAQEREKAARRESN